MTTELDIANRALGLARARTTLTALTGLDPEVVNINLHLGPVRETLLQACQWSFAKSFAPLKLTKSATGAVPWTTAQPPIPWLYQYTMPANCVDVRYILGQPISTTAVTPRFFAQGSSNNAQDAFYYRWELINDNEVVAIATDAYQAVACFTRDVTDPSLWDSTFTEALVTMLASRIVIPLSGDSKLAQLLRAEARELLQEAMVKSANEGVDIVDNYPDTLRARRSDWFD